MQIQKATLNVGGSSMEIETDAGPMRLILNNDGTFRIITDIKVQQVEDLKKENPRFYQHQHVLKIEKFGHPYED
jgi:membrane carboxypeptidase/penicillin-binding protein PbpC